MQAHLLNCLSITFTWLSALQSFLHLHPANNFSGGPPTPKTYANSSLLHICSSFILPTHSFTLPSVFPSQTFLPSSHAVDCYLGQLASLSRDQFKTKQDQKWGEDSFCTLKRISVVMVNPWVMIGSSSGGRPFQQSSSTQRQPASSVWRYISGDEIPENWPAAGEHKQGGSLAIRVGHFLHKLEQQNSAVFEQVCMAEWQDILGNRVTFLLTQHLSVKPLTVLYSPQPSKLQGRCICLIDCQDHSSIPGDGTYLLELKQILELPIPVKYVLCDELMK